MGKWSPAVGLGQRGMEGGVSSHLTALWAQRPSCPRCDPQPYTLRPLPHPHRVSPPPQIQVLASPLAHAAMP